MEVAAIRFHLNGTVEVKPSLDAEWQPFEGVVVNATAVEIQAIRNALADCIHLI